MNPIGKTTVNPILFITGKISGFFSWVVFFMVISGHSIFGIRGKTSSPFIRYFSCLAFGVGLVIVIISLFNLGSSTRMGLPSENTKFKSKGIYRYSRNPMYLGFHLCTLAAMICTANIVVVFLGIYSMAIYHFIIVGEERFLEIRFGNEYVDYRKKTRRYI
jgi:protein-S-isoprenylcysteine O-methyltransferase Ste14